MLQAYSIMSSIVALGFSLKYSLVLMPFEMCIIVIVGIPLHPNDPRQQIQQRTRSENHDADSYNVESSSRAVDQYGQVVERDWHRGGRSQPPHRPGNYCMRCSSLADSLHPRRFPAPA